MEKSLQDSKSDLSAEIDRRIEDRILEPTTAELLKKLIDKSETLTEAISIAELGTTYKRTGLHFDKRLEKFGNSIKYFEKNDALKGKLFENGGILGRLDNLLLPMAFLSQVFGNPQCFAVFGFACALPYTA